MNGDGALALELFGLAIAAALFAGLAVPLVGCFLYVRRTSFHGIVLPQFAAAGIACGFVCLPSLGRRMGFSEAQVEHLLGDTHAALNYHLAWAAAFTFGGLGALAWLGRGRSAHERGSEVGRLAAAFAVASAATLLFAHASPVGEIFVSGLLRGEILFVGPHELETLGAGLGLVLAAIAWFHRDLTLASYDPETALVLGKRVFALELLLQALTGLAIAVCVMTVGPVVLFGLLVLPPIAARGLARSMPGFLGLASAAGVASAALGLWISFGLDAPLGPAVVVAAAGLAALGALGSRSRARAR